MKTKPQSSWSTMRFSRLPLDYLGVWKHTMQGTRSVVTYQSKDTFLSLWLSRSWLGLQGRTAKSCPACLRTMDWSAITLCAPGDAIVYAQGMGRATAPCFIPFPSEGAPYSIQPLLLAATPYWLSTDAVWSELMRKVLVCKILHPYAAHLLRSSQWSISHQSNKHMWALSTRNRKATVFVIRGLRACHKTNRAVYSPAHANPPPPSSSAAVRTWCTFYSTVNSCTFFSRSIFGFFSSSHLRSIQFLNLLDV
jgi:hypothetical protein